MVGRAHTTRRAVKRWHGSDTNKDTNNGKKGRFLIARSFSSMEAIRPARLGSARRRVPACLPACVFPGGGRPLSLHPPRRLGSSDDEWSAAVGRTCCRVKSSFVFFPRFELPGTRRIKGIFGRLGNQIKGLHLPRWPPLLKREEGGVAWRRSESAGRAWAAAGGGGRTLASPRPRHAWMGRRRGNLQQSPRPAV